MNTFSNHGVVEWISIRTQRTIEVESKKEVVALEGIGLEGDHYKANNGSRQGL